MPNSRMADAGKTDFQREPCGIIRIAALCELCRYRHKSHATGSAKRLNRQFGKRFGDDAYAFEEIVASLCQATLCAEYGLPNEIHDSHASYIHHWLQLCSPRHNLANREVSIM